jgi:CheY-like chemotaxis protein
VNIWVVTREALQAAAFEACFRRRLGHALTYRHLRSGLEALELLTHASADVVVCARESDDLTGLALLRRLREGSEVAAVLLDRGALAHFTPGRLDAVLEARAAPDEVVEAALGLLAQCERADELTRPFHGAFPGPRRPDRALKVSGTLEVMTLFDLVLSLTQKRNSGRLYLLLGKVEALLAFQQGHFVHAEYQELTGEAAVVRAFLEAEHYPTAEFFFEPSTSQLPPEGATLHASAEEVLFKVAFALGQQRDAGIA